MEPANVPDLFLVATMGKKPRVFGVQHGTQKTASSEKHREILRIISQNTNFTATECLFCRSIVHRSIPCKVPKCSGGPACPVIQPTRTIQIIGIREELLEELDRLLKELKEDHVHEYGNTEEEIQNGGGKSTGEEEKQPLPPKRKRVRREEIPAVDPNEPDRRPQRKSRKGGALPILEESRPKEAERNRKAEVEVHSISKARRQTNEHSGKEGHLENEVAEEEQQNSLLIDAATPGVHDDEITNTVSFAQEAAEEAAKEEHEYENDNEILEGVGTASSSLEPSLDEIAQETQGNESHSEEFLEVEMDLGDKEDLYEKLEVDLDKYDKPEKEEQVERYEVHESDYSFSDPDGDESCSSDEESSYSSWQPYDDQLENDQQEIIENPNTNSFLNDETSKTDGSCVESTASKMSKNSDRFTCPTSLSEPPVEAEYTDSLADNACSTVDQDEEDHLSPTVDNNLLPSPSVTVHSLENEMPTSSNIPIPVNKYHVGYNISEKAMRAIGLLPPKLYPVGHNMASRAKRAKESLQRKRGRPRKMEPPLGNEQTVSLRPTEGEVPKGWKNFTVMNGYFLDKGPPKTKSRRDGGAELLPGLERISMPKRSKEEMEEVKRKKAEKAILKIDTDTIASIIKPGRPKWGLKHIRKEAHKLKNELAMNNCNVNEASIKKRSNPQSDNAAGTTYVRERNISINPKIPPTT